MTRLIGTVQRKWIALPGLLLVAPGAGLWVPTGCSGAALRSSPRPDPSGSPKRAPKQPLDTKRLRYVRPEHDGCSRIGRFDAD